MQNLNKISNVNRSLNEGESLADLPLILHNSILNWETDRRIEGSKFFQGYEELAARLNVHPQTLRKYTNIGQPKYPPVNVLISICRIINDYTPWYYLNDSIAADNNNK